MVWPQLGFKYRVKGFGFAALTVPPCQPGRSAAIRPLALLEGAPQAAGVSYPLPVHCRTPLVTRPQPCFPVRVFRQHYPCRQVWPPKMMGTLGLASAGQPRLGILIRKVGNFWLAAFLVQVAIFHHRLYLCNLAVFSR